MEPQTTASLIVVLLIIYGTSLHELGHAYVAHWLGDPTPGRHGRLTLNPLPHLAPFSTAVLLPLFAFMIGGFPFGAAFTPVNPTRFKRPLRDYALVGLAGPVMNFVLAGICIGILWIPGAYGYQRGMPINWATAVLPNAALWNIILGVFNLMPVPPLDGYTLLRPLLPLRARRETDAFGRLGMLSLLLAIVVASMLFSNFRKPIYELFFRLLPG